MSTVFATPEEAITTLQPDEPLYCFRPHVLQQTVKRFLTHFRGTPLYAVKCNSHPDVLRVLFESGIHGFDVASLAEIELIKTLFPSAHCAFMHPVKSRPAISNAYQQFGIRHFVIDSLYELEKIEAQTHHARDLTIFVRFGTATQKEVQWDLSAKFGADIATTVSLIHTIQQRGYTLGIAFHVGSQCTHPHAFEAAIERLSQIIETSGAIPAHVDIGGGLPTYYQGIDAVALEPYLQTINQKLMAVPGYGQFEILAEPGRVLVNEAFSLLTQVQLRKDHCLHINDGVYGALGELPHLKGNIQPPARVLDTKRQGQKEWFNLYGPTCDSTDIMNHAIELPNDIAEGDWIEIGMCGAYTHCMSTAFNGFKSQTVIHVQDTPFYHRS